MAELEAVHAAVHAALTAALSAHNCPVFDHATVNRAMPFARIAAHYIDEADAFVEAYTIHRLTIEIHTGQVAGSTGVERSKRQARTLAEAARTALHRVRLPLTSGTCIMTRVERTNIDDNTDTVSTESSLIVRVDVG